MLDYNVYKVLHIVGLVLVFLGVGAVMLGARDNGRAPRGAAALHGVGLLIMLLGGFGMMARLEIAFPWPAWLFGKLGVWIVVALLPILARRGVARGLVGVLLAVGLAGVSAWLAIYKPFV